MDLVRTMCRTFSCRTLCALYDQLSTDLHCFWGPSPCTHIMALPEPCLRPAERLTVPLTTRWSIAIAYRTFGTIDYTDCILLSNAFLAVSARAFYSSHVAGTFFAITAFSSAPWKKYYRPG